VASDGSTQYHDQDPGYRCRSAGDLRTDRPRDQRQCHVDLQSRPLCAGGRSLATATRLDSGQPIDHIASVASFFVSRIETLADRLLAERAGTDPDAGQLQGKVAVAAAKLAYREFQRLCDSREWQTLLQAGARVQRPLWASTSTKNPDYSDVKYVEALIGPDTVTTLPLATIEAYRDHGRPAPRLTADMAAAEAIMTTLPKVGIDFAALARQLETEGVAKFIASYRQLLAALEQATPA